MRARKAMVVQARLNPVYEEERTALEFYQTKFQERG